jgi:hypothetical protein
MNDGLRAIAQLRACLCQPPLQIAIAAKLLDDAVSAHLDGNFERAASLISDANLRKSVNGLKASGARAVRMSGIG